MAGTFSLSEPTIDPPLRPQGGTAPFLAGAYRWKLSGEQRVPLSLVRPLLTVVVFAVLPQCYAGQPYGGGHHVQCRISLVLLTPLLGATTASIMGFSCLEVE